jgi:hypothetical protein
MSAAADTTIQILLREAEADDAVIGCFLGGSRGKGYHDDYSDYDLTIVVADEAATAYAARVDTRRLSGADICVRSLSEFRRYAGWMSDTHWDRYDFTHVRALIDKTGEIQRLIDEKGSIPDDEKRGFISAQLDGYLNGFFRSVKCFARGEPVGLRLEAAGSLPHLLNAVFALHDRAAPFPDYLVRELARRPLGSWPWSAADLCACLLTILERGDLAAQQKLAKTVEDVFRRAGYGRVFDDWMGQDRWAMEYRLGDTIAR